MPQRLDALEADRTRHPEGGDELKRAAQQAALSRADVYHRVVAVPGEFPGKGTPGAGAGAGHRGQESLQLGRIGIESRKNVFATLDFILWLTGA